MTRTRQSLQQVLSDGLREHQQGRSTVAATHYRTVLAQDAGNVDALHLLGVALRDCGDLSEALKTLRRVVHLRPTFAEAHGNLGLVAADAGRFDEAVAAYQEALRLKPSLAEPWYNLANLQRDRGEYAEAARCFEASLARRASIEAWRNYADVLVRLQRLPEASAAYHRATELAPLDAELWNLYGSVLQRLRCFAEAIRCHHRALLLRPDFAEANNNLGNALKDYQRPAEAVVCYRRALALNPSLVAAWNNLGNACLDLGRADEAIAALRQAIELAPDFAEAHLNLGNVLKLLGHLAEATYYFNRALSLKPGFVQAHNNLGVVMTEQGHHADAITHLEQALELDPNFAEAHNNLGNVYKNQARLHEALNEFRQALALRPDYSGAHSNLLFTLNYVDGVLPAEIFDLSRDFNARHAARLAPTSLHYPNDKAFDRRLKIAYVSPDFRAHACAFFLEPLFCHHDRGKVEVYAYAEVAHPDAITQRLRSQVDQWRSTVGLNDEQVAAMIREDQIDIVIDLAGHTANGRLLALARKPAPIQVTYLGYPATTGLDVFDYRLTDHWAEPVGTSEQFYTESLVRLPHSLWCYQPFADMPAVIELPASKTGTLTFGSFNNFAKIGPRVIALWAQVMHAVPDSRLLAITIPAGSAQDALRAEFAGHGIAPERLELHDRVLRQPYLDLFARVDLALDPFPCNGGTTTCDALWMGVPVVSLIGDTFLSRASYSLLKTAGLDAYAASDAAAYIEICVNAARNLKFLERRRAQLRSQLAQSPLLDAPCFTRDVEQAYRAMWQRWCGFR